MIDRSPIKPGEMGIIIASARQDLRALIGLSITCLRYAVPGEVVELTHPIYGYWIHGISRILPIRPDSECEHTEKKKNLKVLYENSYHL